MDNSKEIKPKGRPKKSEDKSRINIVPFCDRLNKLYGERNESQETVAKALGTTRQSFGNWLSGRNQPDYDKLVAIANYYGVSTDYLLGRAKSTKIDEKEKAAVDVTGLSDESITQLASFNNEADYWSRYIIDNILADPHFYVIIHALDDILHTKDYVLDDSYNKNKFPITKRMLIETVINKHFQIIINHIIDAYEEL